MSACPDCGTVKTEVLDTRTLVNGWLRRRRKCSDPECLNRWYTYEVPEVSLDLSAFDPQGLQRLDGK